ncbi:MAG: 3-methyl-2-oxobutanoate hydroxymethyltransferase [Saccharospirillaceae bacterium]|nr:3-methyl-2-oxobutanoate hydroxymethyltransferase [Pseudomonadales bacterium]NRB81700.1 3-methyl-2-oxobutanoate hydroxymethyltransferase [Saccharospirillaceae bacterium]
MKLSTKDFIARKGQTPITMLTAYTTPIAKCLENAGIEIILVGDSLGMVEMGFESTQQVTMEHMEYHIGAVRRGAPNTHIIGDMPYKSTQNIEMAITNAKRLIDAGADSVKIEGPEVENIKAIVNMGIAVVGHTGLTPQTAKNFKQVGNTQEDVARLKQDTQSICNAGVFMLVIEHTKPSLASELSASVTVPTIGIGAGNECDGQVLVINDAAGLGDYWPPFTKQYAQVSEIYADVAKQFKQDVETKQFP